jgi:hypothetical protein
LNSKCLRKQTPADAGVDDSNNRKELLHQRPTKKGYPNEEYRGCHYCSIYDEYISVVAMYNHYISRSNCKNGSHIIITKYINYGIHQLQIIFMLC